MAGTETGAGATVATLPRTSTTYVSFFPDNLDSTGTEVIELFKLDANIVCFGNQKICIDIWKKRRDIGLLDKTLCLPINLADLPDNKYRDSLDTIISEHGIYGSKDYMTTEMLMWDWAVLFFLKYVGEMNPFNTTHFCWVGSDVGAELNQKRLDKLNTSWIQNGIATKGFRMIQTGVTDEQSYLDARSFYNRNLHLIKMSIMGGNVEDINIIYDRLERQKSYLLKIKKVVPCRDILARISYFFNDEFDLINTLFMDKKETNTDNFSYIDVFCQERFNIDNVLDSGNKFRQNEDHISATEMLSKLADALMEGSVVLDKDKTYTLFYNLSISSYYIQYELYKKYTNWFKDYLNRNNYTVDDLFKMNLNF
jgi:hypothetical protein